MKHKGTGFLTNPVENAKQRFLQESKPIKRRISYCHYRYRKVGANKVKRKWLQKRAEAIRELVKLQNEIIRSIDGGNAQVSEVWSENRLHHGA